MARLINSIDLSKSTVTTGERRFAQRLESHLEKDYLCWYDVRIGQNSQFPDFIILHPSRGLLIIEEKGWRITTIRSIDPSRVELETDGAIRRDSNPFMKARQHTMQLVNQLKRDPELCHAHGAYEGQLSFPYGWGVALTNITRKQLNEAIPALDQEDILPPHRVICKDEMTESVDPLEFQERLWGMFEYSFGEPLSVPQIERVRWHIFPEVRIPPEAQTDLFENDFESAPDLVKVFDLQQEQLARNLGSGHRVIHGVAGSGKTMILGYRCLQLAESIQKPILVLCFNVSLASRLRQFATENGIANRVHIHHFHEWCGLQLKTYHVDLPKGEEEYWVRQAHGVISAVEKGFIPRAQYGAVLIDEGHDFEPEWLKLIVQMVDPATDSFLLLYDDAQSIYRKGSGLDFSLSSVGIKAAGRTTILRLNYRNTREILKLAYNFAREFIGPKASDEDHIPLIEPESTGLSGAIPSFRSCKNFAEEVDHAVQSIRAWLDDNIPAREIAVVCFRKYHGKALEYRLAQEGINHLWLGNKAQKKSYDPSKERITILSAQSSKGLEFHSALLFGIGHIKDDPDQVESQTRILYVAMTRAKQRLALSTSASNSFSEKIEMLVKNATTRERSAA
ncbi:MAG: 3'-5' exonuclease [Verrucomicrobiota bacterium]